MQQIKVVRPSEGTFGPGAGGLQKKDLVDETVGPIRIVVRYAELVPGLDSGEHVRDREEILYYLSGELDVEVTGGESYHLTPGCTIFIPPGIKHRHVNRGKETVRQLFIQTEVAK
ncbi:MAG: cupin domain-containing protein [Chloroflexi bacterium]|nr:cupin domain-containing protein [Chloroflexota bacterium]